MIILRKLKEKDILPCVYNYLEELGFTKTIKDLKKESGIDFENEEFEGISNKKMQKIFTSYLISNEKLWPIYEKNKSVKKSKKKYVEEVNEDDENKLEKKIKSKKEKTVHPDILGAVRKRSRALSSEIEGNPKKKSKKTKPTENDSEEYELSHEHPLEIIAQNGNNEKTFFQKDSSLKDNTFEAKYKYGGGDEYGKIGHQRLVHTRGKDFKKEKNKLKNKGFIGGSNLIDIHKVNAIKL